MDQLEVDRRFAELVAQLAEDGASGAHASGADRPRAGALVALAAVTLWPVGAYALVALLIALA